MSQWEILNKPHPIMYAGVMKKELTLISKLLRRKQRMFMVQPVSAVVQHKRFFGKQSKRLRLFQEISHGTCFFYGGVDDLARSLEHMEVHSEDDEFWDKYFLVMDEVYEMRMRGISESGVVLTDDDRTIISKIIGSLISPILILPDGDVISVSHRLNPSGADATTENNCVGRKLIENYIRICFAAEHGFSLPRSSLKSTKFCGDDRIAGMGEHPDGYGKYYVEKIKECGVRIKTLEITDGPLGAEFCGFRIVRSWWDSSLYVPQYNLDRLYAGLVIPVDKDRNITYSRLMAMALLFYPHRDVFKSLRPRIITFLQKDVACVYSSVAMQFWSEENYLQHMWSGRESHLVFEDVHPQLNHGLSLLEEVGIKILNVD